MQKFFKGKQNQKVVNVLVLMALLITTVVSSWHMAFAEESTGGDSSSTTVTEEGSGSESTSTDTGSGTTSDTTTDTTTVTDTTADSGIVPETVIPAVTEAPATTTPEAIVLKDSTEMPYISSVKLTVNGEVVLPDDTNDAPIEQKAPVDIEYLWAIPNGTDLEKDHTLTVAVPGVFNITNNLSGPMSVPGGDEVGNYLYDYIKKTLTLTFNSNASNYSGVEGFVKISTWFKLPEDGNNSSLQEIKFPISEDQEKIFNIKFKPDNVSRTIEKRGEPDKIIAPTEITWTVDVNKTMNKVGDILVVDQYTEGQTFIEGSMKMYKLDVDLNGDATVVPGSETVVIPTEDTATRKVSLPLKDVSSAYRLVYKTAIIDSTKTEYKNVATIFYGENNATQGDSSEAGVKYNNLKTTMEKNGNFDETNPNIINWTVVLNEEHLPLVDATLRDLLPAGTAYVEKSIKVYKKSATDTGWSLVTIASPMTTYGKDRSITIRFSDQKTTTSDAYKVEYSSTITNPTYTSFTNSAKLYFGTKEHAKASAKVESELVLNKTGTINTVDYKNYYIDWTITVNSSKKSLEN